MTLRNVKTRTGKYVHRAYVYTVHFNGAVSLSINVVCNRVPNWCYSLAVTDDQVTCPKCLAKKR